MITTTIKYKNVTLSNRILNTLLSIPFKPTYVKCAICNKELVYMGIKISENKFRHNYKCN